MAGIRNTPCRNARWGSASIASGVNFSCLGRWFPMRRGIVVYHVAFVSISASASMTCCMRELAASGRSNCAPRRNSCSPRAALGACGGAPKAADGSDGGSGSAPSSSESLYSLVAGGAASGGASKATTPGCGVSARGTSVGGIVCDSASARGKCFGTIFGIIFDGDSVGRSLKSSASISDPMSVDGAIADVGADPSGAASVTADLWIVFAGEGARNTDHIFRTHWKQQAGPGLRNQSTLVARIRYTLPARTCREMWTCSEML